jgi:hypothetical protein
MPTNEAIGKDSSLKWDVFITPGIPVVTKSQSLRRIIDPCLFPWLSF